MLDLYIKQDSAGEKYRQPRLQRHDEVVEESDQ